VQTAGGIVGGSIPTTPGDRTCGFGSQVCDPAIMQVVWKGVPLAPFTSISGTSFTLNLTSDIEAAVINIGPQQLNLVTLGTSPQIVPTTLTVTDTFAPRYMYGNPSTATINTTTTTDTTSFHTYSNFSQFLDALHTDLSSKAPAREMVAKGVYDSATNTFTATSIDFVI
jgi:hypothetical protein